MPQLGGAFIRRGLCRRQPACLNVDTTQTTVSGLSSGGFMAVQLHWPTRPPVQGRRRVCGGAVLLRRRLGPTATSLHGQPSGIPTSTLVNTTNSLGQPGLASTRCPTCSHPRSTCSRHQRQRGQDRRDGRPADLLQQLCATANMVYKKDIAAEHAMVTDDYGSNLLGQGRPLHQRLQLRPGRRVLQQFYGTLNARNNGACPLATLSSSTRASSSPTMAWPPPAGPMCRQACPAAATCRLHVVLHGCKQNVSDRAAAVRAQHRLQPLGRHQQHRRAVPADQHRRHQQLLGLVGL
jgi:hypothetical protein